jgi:DNA-binding NarL/FixJ family response regulator
VPDPSSSHAAHHGSAAQTVRLIVVDPHAAVREGLPLLFRDASIVVEAAVASAAEAVDALTRHRPDVALVAAGGAHDPAALAAVASLVRFETRTPIVAYVDGEESAVTSVAVRAGVAGVVARGRPVAQLARALRAVAAGGLWFDEHDWSAAPLSPAAEEALSRSDGLSISEKRVLALVAAGASTDEIGSSLGVSPHTVRTHVRNLMRKLDAQSRAHAVAIALRDAAIELV